MGDKEQLDVKKEQATNDGFVFMREEIKSRPLNKKHLARNTILAAISAVVFGTVACVTFALVAPFIMDKMGSDRTEEEEYVSPIITLPAETEDEEMNPEDMLVSSDKVEIELGDLDLLDETEIKDLISSITFTVSDYQNLYKSLSEIANEAKKSLVRVTPVKTNTNWLNSLYETQSELTGLIVASNDSEYYILTHNPKVKDYETIIVTFDNGMQVKADFLSEDPATDLAMLSVSLQDVNEATKENIEVATLGSSISSSVLGSPVIAIGSPMGTYNSVNYGMVTSNSTKINVVDNYYTKLVTNIYGSENASGVVVNLKGEVIGIIDNKFTGPDTKNIISTIGITELKRTIEDLINKTKVVKLGITGNNVPVEAVSLGTPKGVYVLSVEFDSPAMKAGMQTGDIITSIGPSSISRFAELVSALKSISLDSTETVVVYRSVQDTYKEVFLEVEFNSLNE